jgi:hypothetical protein
MKSKEHDLIIVKIYVNDILFGATNESLCKDFESYMHIEFEISMMGELTFFLKNQAR